MLHSVGSSSLRETSKALLNSRALKPLNERDALQGKFTHIQWCSIWWNSGTGLYVDSNTERLHHRPNKTFNVCVWGYTSGQSSHWISTGIKTQRDSNWGKFWLRSPVYGRKLNNVLVYEICIALCLVMTVEGCVCGREPEMCICKMLRWSCFLHHLFTWSSSLHHEIRSSPFIETLSPRFLPDPPLHPITDEILLLTRKNRNNWLHPKHPTSVPCGKSFSRSAPRERRQTKLGSGQRNWNYGADAYVLNKPYLTSSNHCLLRVISSGDITVAWSL